MKTIVFIVALVLCCFVVGCSPETIAGGGGVAAGLGLSNTIAGMQADLEAREKALVDRYNQLVEIGAKAEDLAEVKQQIASIQVARQGTETITTTDWSDPAAMGGGIGTLAALAYAFVKRKELINTTAGIKSFRSQANEETKHSLDSALLSKGVT